VDVKKIAQAGAAVRRQQADDQTTSFRHGLDNEV
jgi:hypothetical protein